MSRRDRARKRRLKAARAWHARTREHAPSDQHMAAIRAELRHGRYDTGSLATTPHVFGLDRREPPRFPPPDLDLPPARCCHCAKVGPELVVDFEPHGGWYIARCGSCFLEWERHRTLVRTAPACSVSDSPLLGDR